MRSGSDSLRPPMRVMPAPATHTSSIGAPACPAGSRHVKVTRRGASPPFRYLPPGSVAPAEPALEPRGVRGRPSGLREGPPSRGGRRRGDSELANQAEEVGALEAEHARGMGAVAAHPVERRFDQPSLELRDGAVIAEARLEWRERR